MKDLEDRCRSTYVVKLNERQMEKCKNTCEIFLTRYRRKQFLHRTVTAHEKWIYFENPKRKKLCVDSRRTIHIDGKTESLWQNDDTLCLVDPEGRGLI